VAGASYSWTGPNGFSSNLQNPTISNVTASNTGTYSLVAIANGCTSSVATTNVVVSPIPTSPTASSNSPLCVGSTLNLTASSVAGATYNWTGPNGFTSTLQNPSISGVTSADAGTYSVIAIITGCTSSVATTVVTINAVPTTPVAGSNSPICEGSSLNLTATTIPGATYSWTGPAFSSTSQNPTIAVSTTANSGTYNVVAIANGCTSSVASVTVVVNPKPTAPVAGSNSPICEGQTLNLTASTVSGANYLWSGPNGYSSNLQNPTISNATTANNGSYTVVAIASGCTSLVGSVNVTINPVPNPASASNNGPLCEGQTLNLTATAVSGASYSWSGPNGFSSNQQNPTIGGVTLANGGTYNVVTVAAGCTSAVSSTVVVINPAPTAPTAGNNSPLCVGSTLNLTSSAVAGASYSWTGPNGFSSNLQNPTISNVTASNTGTYSLVAIANGCTSSVATTNVVINAVPAAPNAASNSPICEGGNLNLTASAVPGANYSWTGPNGFTSSAQNPTINGTTSLNAGTYSVVAIANGCTSSIATTTVTINAIPGPISASNNSPVCSGNSVNLTATSIQGASYSWTGPNGFVSSVQNPILPNVSTADSGNYSVVAILNGCTSAVAVTKIIVNQSAQSTFVASGNTVCIGQDGTVTISNAQLGATYELRDAFNNSVGTPIVASGTTITINVPASNLSQPSTSFNVYVSLAQCTTASATPVTIVVNPLPSLSVNASGNTACLGGVSTITLVGTENGVTYQVIDSLGNSVGSPIIGNGGNMVITIPISNLAVGPNRFTITATSSSNCSATLSAIAIVTVNPLPILTAQVENAVSCLGQNTYVTVRNSIAGVTYQLMQNGLPIGNGVAGTGGDITILVPNGNLTTGLNSFVVQATNAQGCVAQYLTPVTVNVIIQNDVTLRAVPSNNVCQGVPTTFIASTIPYDPVFNFNFFINGVLQQSSPDSTFTTAVLGQGDVVSVVAGIGTCVDSATLNITVRPRPTFDIVTNTVCQGDVSVISFVNQSGVGFTFEVSGDGGLPSVTTADSVIAFVYPAAGVFNVQVRALGPNGCDTSFASTITVIPMADLTTVPISPICSGNSVTLAINNPQTGVQYYWYNVPLGGTPLDSGSVFITSLLYDTTTFYVEGLNGACLSPVRSAIGVSVIRTPDAMMLPIESDTLFFPHSSVNFQNLTDPATAESYLWVFGDGDTALTTNPNFNPTHQYREKGVYHACLIAFNRGCTDTVCVDITVMDVVLVHIPTGFTPNGDGLNDLLEIVAPGVTEISFTIYDRWGREMYTTENYLIGQPWDGRAKGGVDAPEGAYIYKGTATGWDGRKIELKGTITLIR
ncbi:MAG: gliding motility-associated C-terminal domain-containing protein, partial [Bacteroidia bacterium]|nr:gliding motility-associated C-terminal domain-containing protein [Bacteroidia bacterium]